jgi:hypothetical protein
VLFAAACARVNGLDTSEAATGEAGTAARMDGEVAALDASSVRRRWFFDRMAIRLRVRAVARSMAT